MPMFVVQKVPGGEICMLIPKGARVEFREESQLKMPREEVTAVIEGTADAIMLPLPIEHVRRHFPFVLNR